MAARVVRPHHYAAYGLTDILGAGSMAVLSAWVVFFYTTYCGLTIAQATGIFVIARLLDAIWIHLVPILLGGGTPLFRGERAELLPEANPALGSVTHLRFRIGKEE